MAQTVSSTPCLMATAPCGIMSMLLRAARNASVILMPRNAARTGAGEAVATVTTGWKSVTRKTGVPLILQTGVRPSSITMAISISQPMAMTSMQLHSHRMVSTPVTILHGVVSLAMVATMLPCSSNLRLSTMSPTRFPLPVTKCSLAIHSRSMPSRAIR